MKPRMSKEEIENAKKEFSYINDCYKELILENIDIKNYEFFGELTRKELEYIAFYEVNTRCFFKVHDNMEGTNQEITCFYRIEKEKLPKLVGLKEFKRGFKYYMAFKGLEYKSKLVSFTTFTTFINTFKDLIDNLERKFIVQNYC